MRLLYAEDEKSLARAVSTILIRNNYSVDVVCDGESALDYLATGNYDGAILEATLPRTKEMTLDEVRDYLFSLAHAKR